MINVIGQKGMRTHNGEWTIFFTISLIIIIIDTINLNNYRELHNKAIELTNAVRTPRTVIPTIGAT